MQQQKSQVSYLRYKHVWKYVDVDTGEEITKHLALSAYAKRQIKHKYFKSTNENGKTIGIAQHTVECKHKRQINLF